VKYLTIEIIKLYFKLFIYIYIYIYIYILYFVHKCTMKNIYIKEIHDTNLGLVYIVIFIIISANKNQIKFVPSGSGYYLSELD